MKDTLRPAATVILVRDNKNSVEVLLLQRNSNASFLPGHWVFPGGAVDEQDLPGGSEINRARIAACREANEEAGVTLDHQSLVTFSHWTAPTNMVKRFSTWFFIAPFNDQKDIEIDHQEIQDSQWLKPSVAIALHHQGKLPIMPPTYKSLFEITTANNTSALIKHTKKQPALKYFPKIVEYQNTKVFLYNNDSGYDNADPSNTARLDRISLENNIIHYQYNRDQ